MGLRPRDGVHDDGLAFLLFSSFDELLLFSIRVSIFGGFVVDGWRFLLFRQVGNGQNFRELLERYKLH